MSELTVEQKIAYSTFIKHRNKVGLVKTKTSRGGTWIRLADVTECVDVEGFNHPFYVHNEDWDVYKDAFSNWLQVEPQSRNDERMRMSRGDYGTQDNWDEKGSKVADTYSKVKGE